MNKQQQQQEVDIEEKKRVLEEVERGYRGALVDAGEKVSVVGQLFHLVERYSRRLDQVHSLQLVVASYTCEASVLVRTFFFSNPTFGEPLQLFHSIGFDIRIVMS